MSLRNSPPFMGPGRTSPYTRKRTRGLWPDSDKYSRQTLHPSYEYRLKILDWYAPLFSKWRYIFTFSDETFMHILRSSDLCYMPCPSYSPWFFHL